MADQSDREYRLYEDARTKYSKLIDEFNLDDELIGGDFKVLQVDAMSEPLDLTVPPTARNAVDNAADHILTVPRVRVPVRPSESKQEEQARIAERKQQFLSMFYSRCFEDFGDPVGRAVRSIIKGKAALKLNLRWDLLPDRPEDGADDAYRAALERVGKYRFLWTLDCIPKETVYEDPSSPWDPHWLFEAYEITVDEAQRKFFRDGRPAPASISPEGGAFEKVQYVEYWEKPEGDSKGKFIQWVADERVHAADNPYHWETPISTEAKPDYDGFLPYEIGASGWGDWGKDQKPEDYYVSIVKPLRSVVTAEARYLTMLDYGVRLYTFKPIVGKNLGDKNLVNSPGAIWDLTEDQSLDVMQFGEIPLTLLQAMQRVGEYVDQTAKLGTMGGTPQRGVDTATEADQNLRSAATKLNRPISSIRRMLQRINTKVLQSIEHVIEGPVTLYGASSLGVSEARLTPSDINGFTATTVELGTSDEEFTNTRNLIAWGNAAQAVPISFRTVMQKGGIENATGEMLERMVEDLERSEPAIQTLTLAMLEGLGANGAVVAAGLRQQLATPRQPAPGGTPPSPGAGDQTQLPENVEATRTVARDEAIQNQPERSFL